MNLLNSWQGLVRNFVWILCLLAIHLPTQATEVPAVWPWHGVSMGFPEATPADLVRYKNELGINAVRLQVKARQYAEKNKISGEKALDVGLLWADKMLDTCAKLGVVAVVNISQFPLNPALPAQTTPEFWENADHRQEVLATVQKVVEHLSYRGGELAAYDFMSEPVIVRDKLSEAPQQWPELLQQIVSTVNTEDPNRWLLVSPGPWGGVDGYRDFIPPAGNRLVWGVHIYTPHRFTHQGINGIPAGATYPGVVGMRPWNSTLLRASMRPLNNFIKKYPGPVFVGEFGALRWAEGGEGYLEDLATIFDDSGWGWAYFSATGWHGWNPDYNSEFGDSQQAQKQLVGDKSQRWKTLRSIYKTKGSTK